MRWTWNDRESRENERKHGLSFETARLVFDDPYAATREDEHSPECRWQTIGMVENLTLVVVHTWPAPEGNDEVGRIISARKATPHERSGYEEGIHQLTDKQKAELGALEVLPDDQIDTSDIPEVRDWSDARRGLFYRPVRQQIPLVRPAARRLVIGSKPSPKTGDRVANSSTFEMKFADTRPWLYHLTARMNVERIREEGRLDCAATLLRAGDRESVVRQRRESCEVVRVRDSSIHIRDQRPLHRKNMSLLGGWGFEDWVEHLNGLVFFWPGSDERPVCNGVRHYQRYKGDEVCVIRVGTKDTFDKNRPAEPRFSRYNSGSPRCSKGKRSPRGPDTIVSGDRFKDAPSDVVEVAYRKQVTLPKSAQVACTPFGEWRPLFD